MPAQRQQVIRTLPDRRGRGKQGKISVSQSLLLGLGAIFVVVWIANDQQPYINQNVGAENISPISSETMKQWRESTLQSCQALIDSDSTETEKVGKKEELEVKALAAINLPAVPTLRSEAPAIHKKYEYCKFGFIDLGTNIGDSIGHFVDNSLDVCAPLWKKAFPKTRNNIEFPHPHLDVGKLKIYNKGFATNPLLPTLRRFMEGTEMTPEDTCVYGMEGNPTFTERLQKLENFIMDMKPRPVRHLHIHTESVVTAEDGPTKLYLDKTSVEKNFWGSSILSSQQDAVKSAKELNNGQAIAADVAGIRLTSLVKNTMLPFKPDATDDEKKGGTLIVKMDVEGAEFMVIKEIAKSNIMCDYIKMGNKVIMIVEMHNMSITDPKERQGLRDGFQAAKKQLLDCGVQFGNLSANWS